MTKDAFDRALSGCQLMPQGIMRYATEASALLDDTGRNNLWKALEQEYSQFVPLVQRKVDHMQHTIAEIETAKQTTISRPKKDHSGHAAIVRQMNGMVG